MLFLKVRSRSSNTESRRIIDIRLDGCHPGDVLVSYPRAEQVNYQVLAIGVCVFGKTIRHVRLYAPYVLQVHIFFFCCALINSVMLKRVKPVVCKSEIAFFQNSR